MEENYETNVDDIENILAERDTDSPEAFLEDVLSDDSYDDDSGEEDSDMSDSEL